jgi:FtsH-binding integral membrane protein
MANLDPRTGIAPARSATQTGVAYDEGLRSYMLSIYNHMASAVLLTGLVAMLFARGGEQSMAYNLLANGGALKWVVMLAPLGLVMWLSMGINRLSESSAKAIYWAYAVLMGLSLSTILLVYTGGSVAKTFFAASAAFGGLSLYGYTTKKDLSGFGTFLIMGLVGLIAASILNIFLKSSGLDFAISAIGVLLFAALTAYDTQKIKLMYDQVGNSEMRGKAVIMGALTLYLDFINLFLFLLRFMGDRR